MGRKGKNGSAPRDAGWKKPVFGILLAGCALFSVLALSSSQPRGAAGKWAGPVGCGLAGSRLETAGIGAYASVIFLLAVACALLVGRPRLSFARAGSWLTFSLCTMGLVDLLVHVRVQGRGAGGAAGAMLAGAARSALSVPGAAVLLCAVAAAALVVATDLWALHAARGAARLGVAGGALAVRGAAAAIAKARTVSSRDEADLLAGDDGRIVDPRGNAGLALAAAAADERPEDPGEPVVAGGRRKSMPDQVASAVPSEPPVATDRAIAPVESAPPPQIVEPKTSLRPSQYPFPPKPGSVEPAGSFTMAPGHSAFVPPPISILTGEASPALPLDHDGLTATAEKLRQKLASFGIQGQVTQIRPGPAMAMEALRVRIVAPIPGKGVVGIEVPNKQRETVVLRELVEQDAFQKSHSKLAMCLGKDIEGMPYVADLAKMPHLLIAGTTGSGKSVAVNSMIVSMLLRATPEEVRFLMVDPKMLELSVYEGIPHLLLPVVTDAKKAAMALRWAVEEMERRYQLLADCAARNIASSNKKLEKEGEGAQLKALRSVRAKKPADPGSELAQADLPLEQQREPLRKLPYLVLIIDELADL